MRILASNPDTIGDVLLRQPLYHALKQAGHELCLIIRPLLEPIIPLIVPGVRVIVCREKLYEPGLDPGAASLAPIVDEARAFAPELLLVAPYQWTALEVRLSHELGDIPCVAMTGKCYSSAEEPRRPTLRVTRSVAVSEEFPETHKNQLLAGAVLGAAAELPDPVLDPSPECLSVADAALARLGLEPGSYWAACVGDTEYSRVRNWEPDHWAALLSGWTARHQRRFLLIGHESERESLEGIARQMTEHPLIWCGGDDGDLHTLLGLIGRSAGYVGRDTGPMHMAAACGKPVLALFGGGTWPRFLPAADRSVSLMVNVPCTGCGWVCHLSRSHCIKDIGLADAMKAADDLESGRVTTRETRVFKPDATLLAGIAREGGIAARDRMIELSVLRREVRPEGEPPSVALERAMKHAARADALAEELEALRAQAARRESILRQRLAALENTAAVREGQLRERLAAAEERLAHHTVSAERLEEVRAAHAQREAALHAQLKSALAELSARATDEDDLRLRVRRLETDREALGALTHQQQTEVVVLRERLNDLLASRWRRYGQRLGLCMTLPWESENGKH